MIIRNNKIKGVTSGTEPDDLVTFSQMIPGLTGATGSIGPTGLTGLIGPTGSALQTANRQIYMGSISNVTASNTQILKITGTDNSLLPLAGDIVFKSGYVYYQI